MQLGANKKYRKHFQKVRYKAMCLSAKHVHATQGNSDPESQESGRIMATAKKIDALLGHALCGRERGSSPEIPPARPWYHCDLCWDAVLGSGRALPAGKDYKND